MLYDVIPDNFFSPLASPGKIVYWECLCRLFAITNRQLSFGVERDVLVDELQFYFDSEMSAELPEEETEVVSGSRDKANFILRKLENCGWIAIDTDHSYVQRVNFRDYAILMMRTLLDISEEKKSEYQAYIYTIYSLCRNIRENPGLGLMQILENTDQLMTGLKSLNSNIKQYIDNLTRQSTVSEILDALLNDYYSNVVDKAYHRLMTSDNVSKFRPEILERLDSYSKSAGFVKKAAEQLAELQELPITESRELVLTMLHEIMEAFRGMDDILNEINQKNTRYQRAAIQRARFLLSSGEDIKGQLKNILEFMNERISEKKLDYNAIYELEEMDHLIRLFSWSYLDMDSLYKPVEGKKEFVPEDRIMPIVDIEERDKKRQAMREHLNRVLSPAKINEYVRWILGNQREMKASDLPLEEEDTFIRLIYIRLYGQRKNMNYQIQLLNKTEKEGFAFRDFLICKKGD